MAKKTLDLDQIVQADSLAVAIRDKYRTWKEGRRLKEAQSAEVLAYVFATDTTTTSNGQLPWKNKTTRPKICQIRDNLKANYMSALFPNDTWFTWEPGDEDAATKEKKLAIEAYMRHIFRSSKFAFTVGQYLDDWIDYGNCIGDIVAVNETQKLGATTLAIYTGPKALRISPLDIVFDITASSFDEAPCITRTTLSIGALHKMLATSPDYETVAKTTIERMSSNRRLIGTAGSNQYDQDKAKRLVADGFSTLPEYYNSGIVELLEFEGDYFDVQSNTLYENHRIVIADRAYVVLNEPITNWSGTRNKRHCGWRLRPDNAWAMGPLDNLVGLQYRIDHLENLKADVFDMIAHPMTTVKGYVEDFEYGPGQRVYMEQDADVQHLRPDSTALNADFQIQNLENSMEELAGAPRSAMGIRTPGEKTAFEVQTLDNAAGRLFQSKVSYFEQFFLEPLINSMLEVARRTLDAPALVSVVSDDLGIREFLQITPEDIRAKGRLVPMGARHFASQAQLVQNLVSLSNTGLYQDPAVQAHLSSKGIAKVLVSALNLDRYNIYAENIRVTEAQETQQLTQQSQEELAMHAMTPIEEPEPNTVEAYGDQNQEV